MNENIFDNIKAICANYPNISLSIQDWCSIMKDKNSLWKMVDIVTTKDLLMNGNYGILFGCRIIVSRVIPEGNFRVSMKIDPINPSKKLEDWSPQMNLKINLHDIERYLKLVAFW